jgi:hypothetical protein
MRFQKQFAIYKDHNSGQNVGWESGLFISTLVPETAPGMTMATLKLHIFLTSSNADFLQ